MANDSNPPATSALTPPVGAAEPLKSKDLRQLARIAGFLKPYKTQATYAALALFVSSATTLAVGQGLKNVVDRGFVNGDAAMLDHALFIMLGILAVMAVATYSRFYFVSWIGERVTADIRRAVFGHLLTLSPGFFE